MNDTDALLNRLVVLLHEDKELHDAVVDLIKSHTLLNESNAALKRQKLDMTATSQSDLNKVRR